MSLRARMGLAAGVAVAIAVIAVAVSAYAGTRSELLGQLDQSLHSLARPLLVNAGVVAGQSPGPGEPGDGPPGFHGAPDSRDRGLGQNDCDEGLGLDNVAQCHAVVLVERSITDEELKSMSAVIESQRQLEDVVDDLLASVHGVPKKKINPVYDTEDIT